MAKEKFYVVKKGNKVGVFNNWNECKIAVDGFSGAEYKAFSSKQDAEAYFNNEDVKEKNINKVKKHAAENNQLVCFIDGSYNDSSKRYSFGCILITPNGDVIKESGSGEDAEAVIIRNVAGELQGVIFALKWAQANNFNNVQINYDYEGIEKWAVGKWNAKNKIAKIYVNEINKYRESIKISFLKRDAHTNDPLNDEADSLAKDACKSGIRAKINKGDYWFNVEGISLDELCSVIDLVNEENSKITIHESDIPYGHRFEIIAPDKDRIVITHFVDKNKLTINGKPKKLFSVFTTYITELVDFEKIPEVFNTAFKMDISKENVNTEFSTYLPNAAGKLPAKIERVLLQAVYNLNLVGNMFDATFIAEPAIRALEGHLKYILLSNGIEIQDSNDGRDKFSMFDKKGHYYELKEDSCTRLSSEKAKYIGDFYTYYNKNRHTLSHWDDPTAPKDTTRLLQTPNEAHIIIRDILGRIDMYFTFK